MDPDNTPSTPIQPSPDTPHYKNILVVEDEHFIGELYTRALSKAGYVVTVTVDGEEGLREALTDHYDIILLDIMVPNMTGIEILNRLRAPGQKPIHAKIIITTNLEQKEDAREAIEKQADGYIVKANVTPKELAELLQSLEN